VVGFIQFALPLSSDPVPEVAPEMHGVDIATSKTRKKMLSSVRMETSRRDRSV
jgi:hypothetical protein